MENTSYLFNIYAALRSDLCGSLDVYILNRVESQL